MEGTTERTTATSAMAGVQMWPGPCSSRVWTRSPTSTFIGFCSCDAEATFRLVPCRLIDWMTCCAEAFGRPAIDTEWTGILHSSGRGGTRISHVMAGTILLHGVRCKGLFIAGECSYACAFRLSKFCSFPEENLVRELI